MKPKVLIFCSVFLVGFLTYKMFGTETSPPKPVDALSPKNAALAEPDIEAEPIADPPMPAPVPTPPEANADESGNEADIREVRDPSDDASGATVIEAKAPQGADARPAIVSLVADEQKSTPERERLDNAAQSFRDGKDAVQVFGDQLNAINGTYAGEIVRDGKEPCPASLVIDGMYVPAEGTREADFSGNFVMSFDCSNGTTSKGTFNSKFGQKVKAIGEESKALLLRDGGGNFFQISFSSDYQRIMGNVYDSPSGEDPVFVGRLSAQR